MGNIKLTLEEKLEKIAKKKEKLKIEIAKIRSFEKNAERKKRVSQLIQIGLKIQEYHGGDSEETRLKILKFIDNPVLGAWDIDGGSWNLDPKGNHKIGSVVSNESKKSVIKRLFLNLKYVPE